MSERSHGIVALVATGGIALALTLWNRRCPGLHYDEALFVSGWQPGDPCAWCPSGFPLMSISYLGALKSWLYWPLESRLSAELLRTTSSLLIPLALVVSFFATARLGGVLAAALAALLLALDPAFLFLQRMDWGPVAIGILLRASVLLLLLRWRESGRDAALVAAGLLAGIGLWDKLIFAWSMVGIAVAIVATRSSWPAIRVRQVALSAAATCVGAAPLIAFNVLQPFATLHENEIVETSGLLSQIVERLELTGASLGGTTLYALVNQQSPAAAIECAEPRGVLGALGCGSFPLDGSLLPLAALVVAAIALLFPRDRIGFGARFLGVVVVVTALTLAPFARVWGPHHVAVLLPFPQMLVALVASRGIARWRSGRWAIAAAIGMVAAASAALSLRTAASFGSICGRGFWSAAIYDAADFVARHPGDEILIGDWGFFNQLRLLVPDVPTRNVSWALGVRAPVDELARASTAERSFLVLRGGADTDGTPEGEEALRQIGTAGRCTRVERVLRDQDGRPNARVLELLSGTACAGGPSGS